VEKEGVSVVIPCYNAALYLREAIESVLKQDYAGPIEVLVGEDASADQSRQIAESFGPPVRVLHDPEGKNRGMSAARNRCIELANHPFIAFLDADDYWLPEHISGLVTELAVRPELGLVYDKGYDVTSEGKVICPRFPEPHHPRVSPDDLIVEQCFVPAGVMVRASVFEEVGGFDQSLPHVADQDMWLRILERYPAAHVPQYGYCYRIHAAQNSLKPRLWKSAKQVLENACRRYPYSRRAIRKRKAVLAYRFGQIALTEQKYFKAGLLQTHAALLDPVRAVRELRKRFRHMVWRR
jgi:glycosyltransferase involved in cell wall biosynthesis